MNFLAKQNSQNHSKRGPNYDINNPSNEHKAITHRTAKAKIPPMTIPTTSHSFLLRTHSENIPRILWPNRDSFRTTRYSLPPLFLSLSHFVSLSLALSLSISHAFSTLHSSLITADRVQSAPFTIANQTESIHCANTARAVRQLRLCH